MEIGNFRGVLIDTDTDAKLEVNSHSNPSRVSGGKQLQSSVKGYGCHKFSDYTTAVLIEWAEVRGIQYIAEGLLRSRNVLKQI